MAMTDKQLILMDASNALYNNAIIKREQIKERYIHDELYTFREYQNETIAINERIKTIEEMSSLMLNSL